MTATPGDLKEVFSSIITRQFDSTKLGGTPFDPKRRRRSLFADNNDDDDNNNNTTTISNPITSMIKRNLIDLHDDDDDGSTPASAAATTLDSFFGARSHLLAVDPRSFDRSAFSSAIAESVEKLRDTRDLVYTRRRQAQDAAAERMMMMQQQQQQQQPSSSSSANNYGGGAGGGGGNRGQRGTLARGVSVRKMPSLLSGTKSNLASMRRAHQSDYSSPNSSPKLLSLSANGDSNNNSNNNIFGKTLVEEGSDECGDDDDPLSATLRGSEHAPSVASATKDGAQQQRAADDNDAPAGMAMKRFEDFFWRYSSKDRIPNKTVLTILLQRSQVTDTTKLLIRDMLELDQKEFEDGITSKSQHVVSSAVAVARKPQHHANDSSDPDIEDSARRLHRADDEKHQQKRQQERQRRSDEHQTQHQQQPSASSTSHHQSPSHALGDAPEVHVFVDASLKLLESVILLSDKPYLDLPQLPSKAVLDVAGFFKDLTRLSTELSLLLVDNKSSNRRAAGRKRKELRAAREVACLLVCLAAVIQFRRHRVRTAAAAAGTAATWAARNKKKLDGSNSSSISNNSNPTAKANEQAKEQGETAKPIRGLQCVRFLLSTSSGLVVSSEGTQQQLMELFPGIELDEDEVRKARELAAEKKKEEMMLKLEKEASGEAAAAAAAANDHQLQQQQQQHDALDEALKRKRRKRSAKKRKESQRRRLLGDRAEHGNGFNDDDDEDDDDGDVGDDENQLREQRGAAALVEKRKASVKKRQQVDVSERLLHKLFGAFTDQLRRLRVDEVAEHQASFPGERFLSPPQITVEKRSVFDVPNLCELFPSELRELAYPQLSSSVQAAQRQLAIDNNPLLRSGVVQLPALRNAVEDRRSIVKSRTDDSNTRSDARSNQLRISGSGSVTPQPKSSSSSQQLRLEQRREQQRDIDSGQNFFLTSATTAATGSAIKTPQVAARSVSVLEPSAQAASGQWPSIVSSPSSVLRLGHNHNNNSKNNNNSQIDLPSPMLLRHRRLSLQLVPTTPAVTQQKNAAIKQRQQQQQRQEQQTRRRSAVTPSPMSNNRNNAMNMSSSSNSNHHHHPSQQPRCITPASYLAPMELLPAVMVPTGPFQQHVRVTPPCYEKSVNPLGRALNCLSPGLGDTPAAVGQARALRSRLRQLGN